MAFCGRGRRAPRLRGHIRRPAGGETKRMCVRRCTRLPRTGTRPLPPVPVPVLVPVSSVAASCLVLEGSTRDRELRGSQHSAVRALGGFEKEKWSPIERRFGIPVRLTRRTRVHAHTKWRRTNLLLEFCRSGWVLGSLSRCPSLRPLPIPYKVHTPFSAVTRLIQDIALSYRTRQKRARSLTLA